jgi:ribokinase
MENHKSRIIVVGSANIDLAAIVSKMPAQGETIKCLQSKTSPGGKGANQAVAAAKMGAKVSLVAKVGEDIFGKLIISNLQATGVGTENITTTTDAETGKAFIIICNGDNQIIIDVGSNDKLAASDVERVSGELLNSDGVLLQLEIPLEAVEKTIQICKGRIPVFLNPAPALPLGKSLLQGIDYFIPNQIESSVYTGIDPVDQTSTGKALDFLSGMGIRFPIITMGSKGVAYFNGERNMFAKAFAIESVDSTAAGDTFSGVFAALVSAGLIIDKAVKVAQAAAALTCTRYGAQDAIPGKKEVEEFLNYRNRRP